MKYITFLLLILILTACGSSGTAAIQSPTPTPIAATSTRILIIGGQTSLRWEPVVAEQMAGIATVMHAYLATPQPTGIQAQDGNDGNTTMIAENIDTWMQTKYAFVHVGASLDIDPCHPASMNTTVTEYVANLRYTMQVIKAAGAVPIFDTIIAERCHSNDKAIEYNTAAVAEMVSDGVKVDDLYSILIQNPAYFDAGGNITSDGVTALADSVVQSFGYIPY